MNIFIMQFIFRYRCLVVIIDNNVYVYKYEKSNFDSPLLSFQAKKISLVTQKFVK